VQAVQRVLVVDDDPDTRAVIARTLEADGFDVDTACDSGMALRKIRSARYDLAIVDLMLPDTDGVVLQAQIQDTDPQLSRRLIFTTGYTDRPVVLRYLRRMGRAFLGKPFKAGDLIDAVRTSLAAADPE
jgi:DNA-binding response OmpR family regulator